MDWYFLCVGHFMVMLFHVVDFAFEKPVQSIHWLEITDFSFQMSCNDFLCQQFDVAELAGPVVVQQFGVVFERFITMDIRTCRAEVCFQRFSQRFAVFVAETQAVMFFVESQSNTLSMMKLMASVLTD